MYRQYPKEILPAIERNPLLGRTQHGMEDSNVRQRPGPENSGLVKFLFPNSNAIYLHDTPSKFIWQEDRAFSHVVFV
jgi:hypothetical protein